MAVAQVDADIGTVDAARLLDTRSAGTTTDGIAQGSGRLDADTIIEIPIAGRNDIPDDALAATINLAAIQPTGKGYAILYPCTPRPPTAASLNTTDDVNTSNTTTVRLSPVGTICLYTSNPAHYALDIVGYLPATTVVPPTAMPLTLDEAARRAIDDVLPDMGYPDLGVDDLTYDAEFDPTQYGTRVLESGDVEIHAGSPPNYVNAAIEQRIILKQADDGGWVFFATVPDFDFDADGYVTVDDAVAIGETGTYASVLTGPGERAGIWSRSEPFSVDVTAAAVDHSSYRVVMIRETFPDATYTYDEAEVRADVTDAGALFDEVSYGEFDFDVDVISVPARASSLTFARARDIANTLQLLFSEYQSQADFVFGRPCDLAAVQPGAQVALDDILDGGPNPLGIEITRLDIDGARPYGCAQLGAGELLAIEIGVPSRINLAEYDLLVTVPVGDANMGSAFSSDPVASRITQNGEPVTTKMDYVYSPATPGLRSDLGYGTITSGDPDLRGCIPTSTRTRTRRSSPASPRRWSTRSPTPSGSRPTPTAPIPP